MLMTPAADTTRTRGPAPARAHPDATAEDDDPGAGDDARPLSAVALYTRQCLAHRLLSATEERELARRWRESGHTDTAARDTLVTHNLRLVADMVHTYLGAHPALRCLGFLDLCQEGTIGLAHAVDLFDERTGNKLSTYATWWIRQAIGRAALDDDPVVRVPVHIHERMTRERRQMAAQAAAAAAAAADVQVAQGEHPVRQGRVIRQADRPREDEYVAAARRVRSVASLDVPLSSTAQGTAGESTLADLIADPTEDGADMAEAVCERDAIAVLRADMRALLTPREWTVLEMRFDPHGAATLQAVGKRIGTCRERVRQIEAAALRKLRAGLAQDADDAGTVAVRVRPKRRGATKPKAPPVPVPVRKPCGAGAVGRGTFGVRIEALLDADPSLSTTALAARAGVSRDTAWRHAQTWRDGRAGRERGTGRETAAAMA